MIDRLFDIGVSNAAFAFVIALIAFAVSRNPKRAHLSHLLWLLVFVKLLTPAFFTLSVGERPAPAELAAAPLLEPSSEVALPENPVVLPALESAPVESSPITWETCKAWLIRLWLLGSVILIVWSLLRVFRFRKLLNRETKAAPREVADSARIIAAQMGLSSLPLLRTTKASIPPMVWWSGGRVQIVLPERALAELDPEEWRWVLAHEFAHVKRRDYLVRWIEWLACVLFWWNPVLWLAQRQLRNAEEVCCDHLVLATLEPDPRHYANSILSVVESLLRPVHRPPAMASHVNSGGNLERRMKLIVQRTIQRKSRVLQFGVLLAAAAILPLGIVRGQEEKPEPRHGKYEAIEAEILQALAAGKISAEEAQKKLIAVRSKLHANDGKKDHAKDRPKDRDRKSDRKPDARQAKFEAAVEDIKAVVEAGKLSREDAEERIARLKKKLWPDRAHAKDKDEARGGDPRHRRLEAAVKELKAAVEAGKLSPGEARERIQELKKKLQANQEPSRNRGETDLERRKKLYYAFEADLKAAVEAGKISKEDAGKKLAEVKKQLFSDKARSQGQDHEWREKNVRAVEADLRAAVKAGKVSEEEARKKLQEMRKKLRGDVKKAWETDAKKKDHYQEVEAELKQALKAGKISEEQFHQRLKRVKMKLWPDRAP